MGQPRSDWPTAISVGNCLVDWRKRAQPIVSSATPEQPVLGSTGKQVEHESWGASWSAQLPCGFQSLTAGGPPLISPNGDLYRSVSPGFP